MWAIFPELNSLKRLHSGSKRQRKIHPCVFKRRIKTGRRGLLEVEVQYKKKSTLKNTKQSFFKCSLLCSTDWYLISAKKRP